MVSRAGVKLRPTIEREALYRLVIALRKEGLSYNQIIRRIESERGIVLRKSHISGWINGKHNPFGYVARFEATPRPELAYVIGVCLGDASTSLGKSYNHKIKLRVVDKEFTAEFARCLGILLCRSPARVKWHEKTRSWHAEVSSVLLRTFLKRDLRELMPSIVHCPACKSAFLRGFYDSEGSVSGRDIRVYNGDPDKLELVCKLLASLGIEFTGPHLRGERGGTVSIKGKEYNVNKDQYYVHVKTASLFAFYNRVGFSIRRKQERLEMALKITSR